MAQQANSNDGLNSAPPSSVKCVGQCGFFGNPLTDNMCSKCYRDSKAKLAPPAPLVQPVISSPEKPVEKMEVEPSPVEPPKEVLPTKEVQSDTTKCWTCKKRVGLLGFKCKCSYVYCSKHRYPDQHPCDFDFKAEGKKLIEKNNPVVKGMKITPL